MFQRRKKRYHVWPDSEFLRQYSFWFWLFTFPYYLIFSFNKKQVNIQKFFKIKIFRNKFTSTKVTLFLSYSCNNQNIYLPYIFLKGYEKSPLQYMKIIFLSKVIPVSRAPCLFTFFFRSPRPLAYIWTLKSASDLYGNTTSIYGRWERKRKRFYGRIPLNWREQITKWCHLKNSNKQKPIL